MKVIVPALPLQPTQNLQQFPNSATNSNNNNGAFIPGFTQPLQYGQGISSPAEGILK